MVSDAEKFTRFCESDFGKRILEKEVEYVYRELKGSQRILDVGCGIGQVEQMLQNLNIVGLDISEEMLQEARKRSNKTFVIGNAESLDFNNNQFDAVFYIATLEFLDDYPRAVQEAYRVTKPNGKILVMMLNPESDYFKEHMQREGSYFRKVRHTNIREVADYISGFYEVSRKDYFLGIRGGNIYEK